MLVVRPAFLRFSEPVCLSISSRLSFKFECNCLLSGSELKALGEIESFQNGIATEMACFFFNVSIRHESENVSLDTLAAQPVLIL